MEAFIKLQQQCELLYQGALAEKGRLQSEVERLSIENSTLATKNANLTKELLETHECLKLHRCHEGHLPQSSSNQPSILGGSSGTVVSGQGVTEDEVAQEVEALSSLPLDSQFEPDEDFIMVEPEVQKSYAGVPSPIRVSRPILDDFFGTAPTQFGGDESRDSVINCTEPSSRRTLRTPSPGIILPATPPRHNSRVLVRESPVAHPRIQSGPRFFIPETVPEHGEITPQKNCNVIEFDDNISNDSDGFSVKNGLRLTPAEKLMYVKRPKLDLDMASVLSPIKHDLQPLSQLTPSKPPAVKGKSPRGKTPKKVLNKSNYIEVEAGMNGIHKMKQTQLNLDYFMANAVRKKEKSTSTGAIDASCSTPKAGSSFPFARPTMKEKATSPLQSLENSPDLDETNLSASAIHRVAPDLCQPSAKENVDVPCAASAACKRDDRQAPRPNCKEARRQIPGRACTCCAAYFDAFGGNDALKQEAMNKMSRHRNVPQNIPETPPGFWRPMITQTPDPN